MSNFQGPYQKISWLERRVNALESMVRKVITPGGVVSGGTSGGPTTLGVLTEHDHTGTGEGGVLTGDRHDSHSEFNEIAAPSTPAAGRVRLYAKADGNLYQQDDAGTEINLAAGGAGSVATDAIWDAKGDLAGGTGANTAARLAVGANDTILMADTAQATGLKWVASATPSTQAFGDAAVVGTGDTFTRGDHKHAMMADPVTAHVAAGDPHTGYVLESLLDAKGDIYAATADNTPARLAVGANDFVLTADSAQATGLKWAAGGGSFNYGKTIAVSAGAYIN